MDALVLLCSRMPSNRGRLPGVTLLCTVCLGKFNRPGKFHVSLNRENITRQKYLGFVTSRKSMTHRKKKWMKEVWSLFFFYIIYDGFLRLPQYVQQNLQAEVKVDWDGLSPSARLSQYLYLKSISTTFLLHFRYFQENGYVIFCSLLKKPSHSSSQIKQGLEIFIKFTAPVPTSKCVMQAHSFKHDSQKPLKSNRFEVV